ncbi:hypothetical protein AAC387_Pa08g1114 [Persea americana]
MANAERAQRIAAGQQVVAVEERMSRMEASMNQMMTCFQMFTQQGQSSSSFEPVGFRCSSRYPARCLTWVAYKRGAQSLLSKPLSCVIQGPQ